MDRLGLATGPPLEAAFGDLPQRAPPSRRNTVTINPLSSNSATVSDTSGPVKIEFELTSNTMIDPYGCYLNFDITAKAPSTSGKLNKFMGAFSVIETVELLSYDNQIIERVDRYNLLSHLIIKSTLTEDYLQSAGSVLWGVVSGKAAAGDNTYDSTNVVPTANYPSPVTATMSLSPQLLLLGLFTSVSGKYFPLHLVTGGLKLRIYLAPPRSVYQTNSTTSVETVTQYTLSNISFTMDTVQLQDPEYEARLQNRLKTSGITLFYDSYSGNSHPIAKDSAQTQITLFNRHPSVKDLYFCMQQNSQIARTSNPTVMPRNGLAEFQVFIGTEPLPNTSFRAGSQSFAELRKSFNKLTDLTPGGIINAISYAAGDAIYGVNYENHLGHSIVGGPILSGLDIANPRQPVNMQLILKAGPVFTEDAQLYTWIHYDYALHIMPDGRIMTVGGAGS